MNALQRSIGYAGSQSAVLPRPTPMVPRSSGHLKSLRGQVRAAAYEGVSDGSLVEGVVSTVFETVSESAYKAADAVSIIAEAVPESAFTVADAVSTITETVTESANKVADAVSNMTETVSEAAVSAYKVSKPTIAYPSGNGLSVPTPKASSFPEFSAPSLPDFSGFSDSLSSGLSGLTDSLSGSASGLTDSLSGGVSGLTKSFSGLTDSVGDSLSGLTGSLSDGVSGLTGGLGESAGEASSAVSGVSGKISDSLSAVTESSAAAVAGVQAAVSSTLGAAADQLLGAVPPEVAATVGEISGHGPEIAVVSILAGIPLASAIYTAKFGGYAGEMTPVSASALLSAQRLVLVDVREEEDREKDGLPDLRLGARAQAVALPLSLASALLSPKMLSQTSSKEQLTFATHAALVLGLKQSPLDKVVVMDCRADSSIARKVARALRADAGISQAYVMQGGFEQWASDGLPVLSNGSAEYDGSAVRALSDELEVFSRSAGEQLSQLSNPAKSVPLVAGGALVVLTVLNYHLTLEIIGIAGLTWSAYNGDFGKLANKVQTMVDESAKKAAAEDAKKKAVAAEAAEKAAVAAQKQAAVDSEKRAQLQLAAAGAAAAAAAAAEIEAAETAAAEAEATEMSAASPVEAGPAAEEAAAAHEMEAAAHEMEAATPMEAAPASEEAAPAPTAETTATSEPVYATPEASSEP